MAKDTRLFAKFDLDYADHPKIVALSDSAFRAHVEMILYSRKYMTDGHIPNRVANRLGYESLSELLSNDPEKPSLIKTDDGGYYLHGYEDMNETKSDIDERKRRNSRNGARGGRPKNPDKTQSVTESVPQSQTQSGTQKKAETETETETDITTKGETLFDKLEAWKPNRKHVEYGKEIGVYVMPEAEKFKAHAIRNDRQLKNINTAFTNWLKKLAPKGHPSTTSDAEAADRLRNPWKYT